MESNLSQDCLTSRNSGSICYKITVPHGPDLIAHGNILDHEYIIEQESWKIAEVSKKWFRVRDTYGIEIGPGQDDILLLAMTVVIDQMSHN